MVISENKPNCEHLIAFVKSSKITDWKRITFQYGNLKEPVFVYRSDDDQTFAKYAKKGSVLWIIESHHKTSPSLVARLPIIGQMHSRLRLEFIDASGIVNIPGEILRSFEYGKKHRWYAVGDPNDSRFFGFNDASNALLKVDLKGQLVPWNEAKNWLPRFGQSLQRPRQIKSGVEELEKLATNLSKRSIFISWKHCDFESQDKKIDELICKLARSGIDCWWDQKALPPSPALSRLNKRPEILSELLDYGLSKSKLLLVLGSKNWGSPSSSDPNRNWTLGEWDRSSIRFVYEMNGKPNNGWPRDLKKENLFAKNAEQDKLVKVLREYLDRM